jgi:hypothetical protein
MKNIPLIVLSTLCGYVFLLGATSGPVRPAEIQPPTRLIVIDDPEVLPGVPPSGSLYDGMLTEPTTRIYLFTSIASTKPPQPSPPPRDIRLTLTNASSHAVDARVLGE